LLSDLLARRGGLRQPALLSGHQQRRSPHVPAAPL